MILSINHFAPATGENCPQLGRVYIFIQCQIVIINKCNVVKKTADFYVKHNQSQLICPSWGQLSPSWGRPGNTTFIIYYTFFLVSSYVLECKRLSSIICCTFRVTYVPQLGIFDPQLGQFGTWYQVRLFIIDLPLHM